MTIQAFVLLFTALRLAPIYLLTYFRVCLFVSEAELVSKMQEAETVYREIVESTQERSSRLEEALFVSENFQQAMMEAMQALRSVHDNLLSQDAPGADPVAVQQQLRELQVLHLNYINFVLLGLALYHLSASSIFVAQYTY